MARELAVPTRLPLEHLSVSSVSLLMRCPEKFRRRYIAREYEAPSPAMILGSAVGAAEGHADQCVIAGQERPSSGEVADLFSEEWEERIAREEIEWREEKPGEVKDVGVAVLGVYEQTIVPAIRPVSVERRFLLDFEGVEWKFEGFIDLEEADGAVVDRKVRKRKLAASDAAADLQATAYLLARRAEANPAPAFRFHAMVKTQRPYAEVVPTQRTDQQLDAFVARLYGLAAELQWRLEYDNWSLAPPDAWWCSATTCGYYASCPGGGLGGLR